MLDAFLLLPAILQGMAMMFDEFYFHRRRGLGRWERIGHPIDTSTVMIAYAFMLWAPWTRENALYFGVASIVSCLMVTKDEFVHQKVCLPGESWLHSALFILHPLVLIAGGVTWYLVRTTDASLWSELSFLTPETLWLALYGQAAIVGAFFLYQTIYWNGIWKPAEST